mgnify:FL=1
MGWFDKNLRDSVRIWEIRKEFEGIIWRNLGEFVETYENLKQCENISKNVEGFKKMKLEKSGRICENARKSEGIWKNLRQSEWNWENLNEFGRIWDILRKSENISENQGESGGIWWIWENLGKLEKIWENLRTSESIWGHLRVSEGIWENMREIGSENLKESE